jgi:hypothetical protein
MRKKLPESIDSCYSCPYFYQGHVIGFSDFKELDHCRLGGFKFSAGGEFPNNCPLETYEKTYRSDQ